MAKVSLEFNTPISDLDEITIMKGATEQVIASEAFDDATFMSKTITLKNNLSNGTYTAILTPADDDEEPTYVEFEAKSATKATSIGVTNKYLVMKDTNFDEGYCFITGFNDFGEQIALSGLTAQAAPGDSTSYDSATGKVTVKYANPGYAVVKNVSVFAQYTGADGEILTCQETLEVTSIGYPSHIEFGEVKKDGTPREDGLITIAELGSNKYYVELDEVQDQYGNDLDAEDLNDLADPAKKLLTIIPTAGSPVFFGTNDTPFSTVNGKVVVFLTAGNGMPGTGALMITGAGGSFSKDITIEDDPYIDEITVDVPDVYEGEWTDEFSFSAVDQYGDEINLYDFAPKSATFTTPLTFSDLNHLTKQSSYIQASDGGTWEVRNDTVKKTFTVRYKPATTTLAKSMISFTTITAGMNTSVRSVTVGGLGGAAQVAAQTSGINVTNGDKTNLNSVVSFKDANGKVMVRTDCYDAYPRFLNAPAGINTKSTIDNDDILSYWWTVTEDKIPDTVTNFAGHYDSDGVIEAKAGTVDNSNGTELYVSGQAGMSTPSYYITLLGYDGNDYKVLDRKTYRFNYSPVSAETPKYKINAISASTLLYATKNSTHSVTIGVTATNSAGETWKPDQSKITLAADNGFTTDGATVLGKHATISGTGSVEVKVYYNSEALGAVSIPYSDAAPVASGTKVKLTTTERMGKDFTADTALTHFTTDSALQANVTMTNGTFKVTNVNDFSDTLEAYVVDQYGRTMTDSKVELDGAAMKAGTKAAKSENNFVITNGSQKIDLTLTAGAGTIKTNAPTTSTSTYKLVENNATTGLQTLAANGTYVFQVQESDGTAYNMTSRGGKVTLTYADGTTVTTPVETAVTAGAGTLGIDANTGIATGLIAITGDATATKNTWLPGTYTLTYTDTKVGTLTATFEVAKANALAAATVAAALKPATIALSADGSQFVVTTTAAQPLNGTFVLKNDDDEVLGSYTGAAPTTTIIFNKDSELTIGAVATADLVADSANAGKFVADNFYITYTPSSSVFNNAIAVDGTAGAVTATYTQKATALGTATTTPTTEGVTSFAKGAATTGAAVKDATNTTALIVLDQYGLAMAAASAADTQIGALPIAGDNTALTATLTWAAGGDAKLVYSANSGTAGLDKVKVLNCTITVTVTAA